MKNSVSRKELIKKYFDFFKRKKHKVIPNASLIPANDPTVLFTTAGMHPLVPYLLGQKHPSGKRLVSVQRCLRTTDIDAVGDATHHTFFEMLGNWSLGDYWKQQAIEFSYEFLTKELGIKPEELSVTCFAGNEDAPKDEESAKAWKSLGINAKKIKFLGKEDNWWGPAGTTGPCGPDTEMFINNVEIWNDVFMQYNKDKRLLLVDGMGCIYDDNFKINRELIEFVNGLNTHTVLTVNGFREKGGNLVKNYDEGISSNWEAFSLEEEGIKKNNPEYFKILLKTFNLVPEEVLYIDHDKKSVETAKKVGILSKHYTSTSAIKKFIGDNLWAFIPLKQQNVDTGMGVERTLAILNGLDDNYMTEVWKPIIDEIESLQSQKYNFDSHSMRAMRIIADHIKAAVFIIADGIHPSNTEQGYVLRRLIRRAIIEGNDLGMKNFVVKVAEPVFKIYDDYPELKKNKKKVFEELRNEEERFGRTLEKGLILLMEKIREIKPSTFNINKKDAKIQKISGKDAFLLYQSYGLPIEYIEETAKKYNIRIDKKSFERELSKHQQLSRTATKGKFASGLADSSIATTRLHTATHLLNEALRQVLGKEVKQRGSNITPERLRFDFNFSRKLTEDEIRKVEALVNKKIKEAIPVAREEMPLKKALSSGAQAEFGARYPDKVSVYSIGSFSKEICTGPHVKNTHEIGNFKIVKEESVASGIRRIKAVVK